MKYRKRLVIESYVKNRNIVYIDVFDHDNKRIFLGGSIPIDKGRTYYLNGLYGVPYLSKFGVIDCKRHSSFPDQNYINKLKEKCAL